LKQQSTIPVSAAAAPPPPVLPPVEATKVVLPESSTLQAEIDEALNNLSVSELKELLNNKGEQEKIYFSIQIK